MRIKIRDAYQFLHKDLKKEVKLYHTWLRND